MTSEEKTNIITGGKSSFPMDFFLSAFNINPPIVGNLLEGKIIEQKGSSVYIDLGPCGTGIIYGREFISAREPLRQLKPNDLVVAKVIDANNETGYIELSLKDAGQEIIWREVKELERKKETLTLPVSDANKGGLILEWKGIQGFLPTSQLRLKHYPRVEGGDKEKILDELKKLVGENIIVTIIDSDSQEKKLIFSEKGTEAEEIKEIISKYKVGDIIECDITGIVDFGIFVKIEEGLEGLIHISELDWALVENPADLYKVGEKVTAQIIEIKNNKISLSSKALKTNPWQAAGEKYKKGEIVKGVVIKFNKHGALVSIEEGVAGLCHISEFGTEKKIKEILELGKSYPFQIVLFEPQDHRLILAFIDEKNPAAALQE